MKTNIATTALVLGLVISPVQIHADPQPPKQDWLLAACVVAGVGLAAGAIYIVASKCEPKYYWLMDSESPPTFWVAACTKKEAQINGWKRIGGPYNKKEDAPPVHPPITNVVNVVSGPQFTIKVQQLTTNGWDTVSTVVCETEEFAYYPTNAGLYRLDMGLP